MTSYQSLIGMVSISQIYTLLVDIVFNIVTSLINIHTSPSNIASDVWMLISGVTDVTMSRLVTNL